jgi:hypothetical protein
MQTRTKKTTKRKAKGLGDTVETVLKATGIASAAKFILGEDCGCDKRKEKLNNLFPYRKTNCLNEEDYNYLDKFFKANASVLYLRDQRALQAIYLRTFGITLQDTSCDSCWRDYVSQLRQVYLEYKD